MTRWIQVLTLFFLFFLGIFSFLTENSDKSQLQNAGFVSAFAIDLMEEDFKVSLEVVNPIRLKMNSTSQESATLTYSATGKTLGDAINTLFLKIPLTIRLNALQLILIQEDVVKSHPIEQIVEYFVRNHDISQSPPVVIVKEGEAKDILEVFLPFNDISAMSVVSNIEKVRSKISDFQYYADDILYLSKLPGKDITLPVVKLAGNEQMAKDPQKIPSITPSVDIKIDGLALFKDGKLIDYMTEENRQIFAYFYEINSFTSITIPCEEKQEKEKFASIKIARNDSEMEVVDWSNEAHPKVHVKIKMSGFLDAYHCKKDCMDEKDFHQIERKVEECVKNNLNFLFEKEKMIHSDFLGIGATLYRFDEKKFKSFQKKYKEPMEQVDFDVTVKMEINSAGDVKRSKKVNG